MGTKSLCGYVCNLEMKGGGMCAHLGRWKVGKKIPCRQSGGEDGADRAVLLSLRWVTHAGWFKDNYMALQMVMENSLRGGAQRRPGKENQVFLFCRSSGSRFSPLLRIPAASQNQSSQHTGWRLSRTSAQGWYGIMVLSIWDKGGLTSGRAPAQPIWMLILGCIIMATF